MSRMQGDFQPSTKVVVSKSVPIVDNPCLVHISYCQMSENRVIPYFSMKRRTVDPVNNLYCNLQ